MEFLEELEETDGITIYTTDEVFTEMVGNIHMTIKRKYGFLHNKSNI